MTVDILIFFLKKEKFQTAQIFDKLKQQFIIKRKIVFEKNDLVIEDHEENMCTLSDI